jgi:hypothetical protein
MTGNEILLLCWHEFSRVPEQAERDLALAACKEERARIVRALEREAKAVDAGVGKPDLWALARLVDEML